MEPISSQIRVTLGRKGQGKSYMLGFDMEQRIKKPFVIIDYGEEHFAFANAHPNAWLIPIQESMIEKIDWNALLKRWHGLIVYPDMIAFDVFTEEIDRLMLAIMDVGGRVVMVEEVQELAPQYGQVSPGFRRLIDQGRKRKIDILAASLKPADVSKSLIAQADDFILFNIHEPNALEYLRRCGLPVDKLPQLQKFEAIYYCPQTGEIRRVKAGKRKLKHYG